MIGARLTLLGRDGNGDQATRGGARLTRDSLEKI